MRPLANQTPGAESRLGTTLSGKWRLDQVLGVGGVATVFLATHRNQSRAALKVLHPEQAQNPIVRERFVHEGYTANSIDHPGVVRVIDDDVTEDGLPYLVMELLEGQTLEDRAHQHGGTLPAADVFALTEQLLEVLVVAHEKRVVHRDLKPDNLFFTREGHLKVLDFGIARLTQAVPHRDVTAVGTLLGTPSFMPPEQARSRWDEVDAQSDLYSVGATMFTLLSGRLVRDADTLTEQLALAIHEPAPKLASVDKLASPAVCAFVDKALAYEKRSRFSDARAMLRELRRVRDSLALPGGAFPSTEHSRGGLPVAHDAPTLLESGRTVAPPPRVSKPITIAIERRVAKVLIAVAVAAALLLWLAGRSENQTPAERARPVNSFAAPAPAPSRAPEPAPARPAPTTPPTEAPRVLASVAVKPPSAHRAPPVADRSPPPVAATAHPSATPSSPLPTAAPAKSSDPFSSRY